MLVEVELTPRSEMADHICSEWFDAWQLQIRDGRIELSGKNALETTLDLQNRCYDQGITANLVFHNSP